MHHQRHPSLAVHPGEILIEEFLRPMRITQTHLAKAIAVPLQRVNELVRGRRGITPDTALRLARALGTTPQFWLNLQMAWDLAGAPEPMDVQPLLTESTAG